MVTGSDAGALERRQFAAAHVEASRLQVQIGMTHSAVRHPHRHLVTNRRRQCVLLLSQLPAPRAECPAMCTLIFHGSSRNVVMAPAQPAPRNWRSGGTESTLIVSLPIRVRTLLCQLQ